MLRFISLLVSLPIIILVAAFAYKNAQLVSIDLFIYQIQLPLAIIMLVMLILGILLGLLFNFILLVRQKRRYQRLKKQKETLKGLSGILGDSEK